MKLITLLACVLLIGGCIGNSLVREVNYGKDGQIVNSKLKVNNLGGMVNVDTNDFEVQVEDFNDGSFKMIIKLKGRKQKHSPESATALTDGATNIITGGASGFVKERLK